MNPLKLPNASFNVVVFSQLVGIATELIEISISWQNIFVYINAELNKVEKFLLTTIETTNVLYLYHAYWRKIYCCHLTDPKFDTINDTHGVNIRKSFALNHKHLKYA